MRKGHILYWAHEAFKSYDSAGFPPPVLLCVSYGVGAIRVRSMKHLNCLENDLWTAGFC